MSYKSWDTPPEGLPAPKSPPHPLPPASISQKEGLDMEKGMVFLRENRELSPALPPSTAGQPQIPPRKIPEIFFSSWKEKKKIPSGSF